MRAADDPADIVIITGMSGAGRSHRGQVAGGPGLVRGRQPAARADPTMVDLGGQVERRGRPDRGRGRRARPGVHRRPQRGARATWARRARPRACVFLEASDDALVRRFESVRRPHPLQGDGRVVDGIAARARAAARAARRRRPGASTPPGSTCTSCAPGSSSFRRRRGGPGCRPPSCRSASSTACRSTPTWSSTAGSCPTRTGCPSCAPITGLDARCATTSSASPAPRSSSTRYAELLRLIARGLRARGQALRDLAVGCTGGKHRSVAIAERARRRGSPCAGPDVQRGAPGHGAGVTAVWRRCARGRRARRRARAGGLTAALRRVTGDLTAVVTVADDGGSSGRLRRELGVLPPGDLRMALAALCGDDEWGTTWSQVVQHRFAARASWTATPSATC